MRTKWVGKVFSFFFFFLNNIIDFRIFFPELNFNFFFEKGNLFLFLDIYIYLKYENIREKIKIKIIEIRIWIFKIDNISSKQNIYVI